MVSVFPRVWVCREPPVLLGCGVSDGGSVEEGDFVLEGSKCGSLRLGVFAHGPPTSIWALGGVFVPNNHWSLNMS